MIHVTAEILNTSIILLIVAQVIVSLLLILVVLMQRPKQEGLGAAFGGGMTDQMFGARTTNVLQKATVWFGILFFGLTLLLAILQGVNNTSANKAIAGDASATSEEAAPSSPSASAGADAELNEQIKAQIEQIEKDNQVAPTAPVSLPETAPATTPAIVEEVKDAVNAASEEIKEEAK